MVGVGVLFMFKLIFFFYIYTNRRNQNSIRQTKVFIHKQRGKFSFKVAEIISVINLHIMSSFENVYNFLMFGLLCLLCIKLRCAINSIRLNKPQYYIIL